MKTVTLQHPITLTVNPFCVRTSRIKDNQQLWLRGTTINLEIIKYEIYKDHVVVEDNDLNRFKIISKTSKKIFETDVIEANCKFRDIPTQIENQTIDFRWKTHEKITTVKKLASKEDISTVINSLSEAVQLKQQILDANGDIKEIGLRPPQIGAIYSILSSLAVENNSVAIVLPTGTGKTETILGTIAVNKVKRSLIIVPSDGLRNQFYDNCLTWGILKTINVINDKAENPIVSKLASVPKNKQLLIELIEGSNIIIATAHILKRLPADILTYLNDNIDAVFIDEAHHSAAPTWESLKALFTKPKIIQLTATPFREDGKSIGAKIIFNYALEDAQKNKYFTKIEFIPVVDYDADNWDRTISEKAIEILKNDIEAGHNHILMARVDNIQKAKFIFENYYEQYKEFNPVLITSKSPSANKGLINQLRSGDSKIVVCVNMLGEGIDIPQLKIAALHDIRKSLTVTLQFIGRFTRSNKSSASAKIVANIADVQIEKKLKQLYKEDADWGKLIAFSSAKEIQKRIKFQEVLANFKDSKIPLFNIKPKLSAVVYLTKDDQWEPNKISKYLEGTDNLFLCDINEQDGIAIAISQTEENIDWMDSKVFTENSWELRLFYFDKKNKLLYVNSSQKEVDYELISRIVKIDHRFEHETPFKCYAGLGHVTLFTLGVDKNTDSPIKYAMYAGSDIFDGISEMEKNKSSKSNTYGYGYNDGNELTLGASKNGKIWSRLVGNIQEWIEWCDEIGAKLTDETINVDDIFKGFLQPLRFNADEFGLFAKPVSIDFPVGFYQENESVQYLVIDGIEIEISSITLAVSSEESGYKIDLIYDDKITTLGLVYNEDKFEYIARNFKTIEYKKRKTSKDFILYLTEEDSFKIRLLDGTFVENNYHFKPHHIEAVFPLDKNSLTEVDWTGVDISKESRGLTEPYALDSIQEKMNQLKHDEKIFKVIFNDDSSYEVADLLCFGEENDQLVIEIIHCKYNLKGNLPGSRISDFYELCGQAQKNIKAIPNLLRLFDHVKTRELKAQKSGNSRFLLGDLKTLELLIKSNSFKKPLIKIVLVQPGLKKDKASLDVLELLGGTYTLLKETLNSRFEVLCS